MFCIKERSEPGAIPGTCRPEDLGGSDVPCDRAVLAKDDFQGLGSQTCWQVSDDRGWPRWGALRCGVTASRNQG